MGRITTNFNVGRVHVPIVGLGQSIGAVCTGARDGATSVYFYTVFNFMRKIRDGEMYGLWNTL